MSKRIISDKDSSVALNWIRKVSNSTDIDSSSIALHQNREVKERITSTNNHSSSI
jgi:hypothetical protein